MPTAAPPYVVGIPGLRAVRTAEYKRVFQSTAPLFLPGGKYIDGTKARDPSNTPYTDALQAGLIMGKITSGGLYVNSIFDGLTNNEVTGSTQLEVSAAAATEIVRRIGATGTLKVTGPPAAGGVVRTLTYTYSAINVSTGAITVTALSANQVQRFRFGTAATGGNLQVTVQKPDGTYVTTGNIAWSGTDATYIANFVIAIDAATGVTGGIVPSAISAVDTDFGFELTYSGTGYAGQNWAMVQVAVLPTGATAPVYTTTTAAADARQIAGNIVQPTDGSETPLTFLPDGPPINVTDLANPTGAANVEFPQLPVAGIITTANLINYAAMDSSLKLWLKQQLSTAQGGKYMYDDTF